jgi:PAS domain S-box-containing protein
MKNAETAEQHARVATSHLRELVDRVRVGRIDRRTLDASIDQNKLDVDAFRDDIDRIGDGEDRLLVERRRNANYHATLASIGAVLLSIASFALLAAAWRIQQARERLLDRLAAEARQRLEALSVVAVALSDTRTREQVAEVVVEHGMRACGADTCILYAADASGKVLNLIGDRGIEPEVLHRIQRITEDVIGEEAFATMRAERSTFVEADVEYLKLFPGLADVDPGIIRAKSYWRVPLIVEGDLVGLLGMGFSRYREFSSEDQAFFETLSKQCAQALLRSYWLEHEDEARRWFTTTLRSIGDAVIATDAGGRISFMNPVAEGLTGWTESDAHGRLLEDVFNVLSEETGAASENPVATVLREGTVVGLAHSTVLRSKDGTVVPIDDSGAPIRNERGDFLGVVIVFRDVRHEKADRLRREFLARASEALVSTVDYEATLATVANVVVPSIADWCVVFIVEPGSKVPRLAAVAHADPDKVGRARELGKRYSPNPDAPIGLMNVLRTGRAELYETITTDFFEIVARDQEHMRLLRELNLNSAMVVPLRARGRTVGAMTFAYADSRRRYTAADLAVAEDFARRAALAIENAVSLKETEAARARERTMRNQAESANRAKDQFLAMVSHELRTPLTAILGWAVTLRNRNQAPELDRPLAVIERNARAQAKLIDDVLDVSRIVSGNLALALGPTDIGRVVVASAETVAPAADAKDISIDLELSTEPMTITADPERVQQIVWNLLSNAVKFTQKGGHVAVEVRKDGSDIHIRVEDDGEGIPRDVLPFIFEPFKQADASPTRRHGGLGLGLAIVKQLVAAHGGTVEAESEGLDKGATFTVRLPARDVNLAAEAPRATTNMLPATAGTPRLDGLRVVVVDDEEDALLLVAEVLRERGAEVTCVVSPTDAVRRVADVRPDVIVSDIGMPEMDGYSLIRRIRSLPTEQGGRTPAVALTAYARTEDAQRAFAAGYQMHVSKPVEPRELATVVANLGGRSLS